MVYPLPATPYPLPYTRYPSPFTLHPLASSLPSALYTIHSILPTLPSTLDPRPLPSSLKPSGHLGPRAPCGVGIGVGACWCWRRPWCVGSGWALVSESMLVLALALALEFCKAVAVRHICSIHMPLEKLQCVFVGVPAASPPPPHHHTHTHTSQYQSSIVAQQASGCRDPGSNRGPSDLRSDALPTKLSRLVADRRSFLCDACHVWPASRGDQHLAHSRGVCAHVRKRPQNREARNAE